MHRRRLDPAGGAGAILRLIREGDARTRADLTATTGLGRSTLTQRIEELLAHDLIRETRTGVSTGGRPPMTLEFNPDAGVALAAEIGPDGGRLAVTDLAGAELAGTWAPITMGDDPAETLAEVDAGLRALLAEARRPQDAVRGIGVALPLPVDLRTGRPARAPGLPDWSGFPVGTWLSSRHHRAPVSVEHAVTLAAVAESALAGDRADHVLFADIGDTIRGAVTSGGRPHRGASGAAGDIGHVAVAGHDDVRCACGNVGCLEAVAGGRAIAQALVAEGRDARDARDVVRLTRAGDVVATRLVRDAGRRVGEVLATCVTLMNPSAMVLGGVLAGAGEQLLAGIREVVFQRSLPVATQDLRIATAALGDRAVAAGAARLALDRVLAPEAIDRALMAAERRPASPRERSHRRTTGETVQR